MDEKALQPVRHDDEALTITRMEAPPGLRISGEIDESNCSALVRALEGLTGSAEIHLDLARVHYADLAFLRAIAHLVAPASDSPATPRTRVVLRDIPPHLHTTLRILGWYDLPWLSIREGREPAE